MAPLIYLLSSIVEKMRCLENNVHSEQGQSRNIGGEYLIAVAYLDGDDLTDRMGAPASTWCSVKHHDHDTAFSSARV